MSDVLIEPQPKRSSLHFHERAGEKIGGGWIVIRRHRTSRRLKIAPFPFEHPTLESAQAEAKNLAQKYPGKLFYIFLQQNDEPFVA